jgi:hypothetical protein
MPATINGVKPADFVTYSEPNQKTVLRLAAPMLLFTAAETYFLLSEAALKNWYTAESASSLYEKGIRAAMQQSFRMRRRFSRTIAAQGILHLYQIITRAMQQAVRFLEDFYIP